MKLIEFYRSFLTSGLDLGGGLGGIGGNGLGNGLGRGRMLSNIPTNTGGLDPLGNTATLLKAVEEGYTEFEKGQQFRLHTGNTTDLKYVGELAQRIEIRVDDEPLEYYTYASFMTKHNHIRCHMLVTALLGTVTLPAALGRRFLQNMKEAMVQVMIEPTLEVIPNSVSSITHHQMSRNLIGEVSFVFDNRNTDIGFSTQGSLVAYDLAMSIGPISRRGLGAGLVNQTDHWIGRNNAIVNPMRLDECIRESLALADVSGGWKATSKATFRLADLRNYSNHELIAAMRQALQNGMSFAGNNSIGVESELKQRGVIRSNAYLASSGVDTELGSVESFSAPQLMVSQLQRPENYVSAIMNSGEKFVPTSDSVLSATSSESTVDIISIAKAADMVKRIESFRLLDNYVLSKALSVEGQTYGLQATYTHDALGGKTLNPDAETSLGSLLPDDMVLYINDIPLNATRTQETQYIVSGYTSQFQWESRDTGIFNFVAVFIAKQNGFERPFINVSDDDNRPVQAVGTQQYQEALSAIVGFDGTNASTGALDDLAAAVELGGEKNLLMYPVYDVPEQVRRRIGFRKLEEVEWFNS
ncbi:hypothetical protein SPFM15_00258 [Salmonella phage SPFM15]|nr:hypothetical protein SPFM5_00253 [Salmonella phage SPFM5]VFR13882.1 hypothetical protein SPFM15_00258 [Salmonella phage SPFM15]